MSIRIKQNITAMTCVGLIISLLSSVTIRTIGPYGNLGVDFFWLLLYTMLLAIVFYRICSTPALKYMIGCAWIIRVLLVPVDLATGIARQPDQFNFMSTAERIILDQPYDDPTGYGKILAMEYGIFGISPFLAKLTNAFIGMIGVAFIMHCMKKLSFSKKTYLICSLIASLAPMTILFSITALRESIYFCTYAASLYFFICWLLENKTRYYVLALCAMIPAVILHTGIISIMAAYLAMMFFNRQGSSSKRILLKMGAVYSGIIVMILVLSGAISANYFDIIGDSGNFYEAFVGHIAWSNGINAAMANTSYLPWTINITNPTQIFFYTPLRMVYFLFSPMIWDISGIAEMFAFMTDSVFFLLLVYYLVRLRKVLGKNHRSLKKTNYNYTMLITTGIVSIVITSILFGWGTIASGTAVRHRNYLFPLVCLMLGVCGETINRCNSQRSIAETGMGSSVSI